MFISIETKTELFFLEACGFRLHNVIPHQKGEPESPKTKTLQVDTLDGDQNNLDLEPGDRVFATNNQGKTINSLKI